MQVTSKPVLQPHANQAAQICIGHHVAHLGQLILLGGNHPNAAIVDDVAQALHRGKRVQRYVGRTRLHDAVNRNGRFHIFINVNAHPVAALYTLLLQDDCQVVGLLLQGGVGDALAVTANSFVGGIGYGRFYQDTFCGKENIIAITPVI